jgi:hypothetical protein
MKTRKNKITSAKNLKSVYNGPAPLISSEPRENIIKKLAVGQLFERRDHSKLEVTLVDKTTVILTLLDTTGAKTETTRRFEKGLFADLMRNKYFEPSKIPHRETYCEIAGKYEFFRLTR